MHSFVVNSPNFKNLSNLDVFYLFYTRKAPFAVILYIGLLMPILLKQIQMSNFRISMMLEEHDVIIKPF